MGLLTGKKSKETPATSSASDNSSRPPSYERVEQEVLLQLPKLNLNELSNVPSSQTVTRDQCVVHLKFLAVLADLRDYISNQDGLFDIYDVDANKFPDSVDEAMIRIKEKRFAVYVARAAERYEKWWFTALPMSRGEATIADQESTTYGTITNGETKVVWSAETLPPLDVLMVWHSHMLNPRNYLEDCIRYGKMSTWQTGFPFEIVNACIDDRTLEYAPDGASKVSFEHQMKLQWDNLQDPLEKKLECPCCKHTILVPWTEGAMTSPLKDAFKRSTGFADKSFETVCKHCLGKVNHGRLRVAKFHKDLIGLLEHDRSIPGALLNMNGMPDDMKLTRPSILQDNMIFPSRFLKACGKDLAAYTDTRIDRCRDINQLSTWLETELRQRAVLKASAQNRTTLRPGEKIHFRRMMSRYWDNFSPFALDLVGAVIRQSTFVQKMDNMDWLHSPAVMETADRLIRKYTIFLTIMFDNPKQMAVPTLDVDLAWHTHQLHPSRYYSYTTGFSAEKSSPRFIDHDDKVDENKLSECFEWTSKMYRRATNGLIYSECTCWYCEATRTPDLYDRVFSIGSSHRARENADSLHDREDISSNPDKNPHISAHNAVASADRNPAEAQVGYIHRMRLAQNYEKFVRRTGKRRRSKGAVETTQDARSTDPIYYMPYVYGYPVIVPYYGPYMCDPAIAANSYACNPSCMSTAIGAVGSCCNGTCGGGVAGGACAGAGGSSCGM
ncbi:hypothetical protein N7540_007375 [Penicillium herquei]|nr:hypothetical protein N7540_007375 [Penicillium herquei]